MGRVYLNNLSSLFNNESQLKNRKVGTFFYFKCSQCGGIFEKRISKSNMNFSFKCVKCNRVSSNLKKYGVENVFMLSSVKDTIKKSNIEKYGVENVNTLAEVREKIKNTRKQRYGEHEEKIVEKSKETFKKNYNVDNPQKCEEIRRKTKETCKNKYGVETPYLYGSNEFKELMKERYGVEHALQNRDLRLKASKRYFYDNQYFDSSYELLYYKYLKEQKIDFLYQPFLENLFYEKDGKKHHYTPDFLVNGELQEIKGDHFFKDGHLYNPFTKQFTLEMEEVWKKFNVKVLRLKDLQNIIGELDFKFARQFLKTN